MNTSILNYPGFQNLPKGTRQMLLFSETHFFNQAVSHPGPVKQIAVREAGPAGAFQLFLRRLSPNAGMTVEAAV